VTARFNKNVLEVINRELAADFDPDQFEHVALWDPDAEWIELRLRSTADQKVTVGDLDLVVPFGTGEEMRTEVSAKFRPEGVRAELAAARFASRAGWTDAAGRFLVTLGEAV
jgi:L-histidine N-alpha-methyltransferase